MFVYAIETFRLGKLHTGLIHMCYKISRTFASLVWLLVYLLMFTGLFPGLLVCVEADGWIQVEVACNCLAGPSWGATSKDASHYHLATLERTPSNDLCGSCVDLPFSISKATSIAPAQNILFQVKLPAPAVGSFFPPDFAGIVTEGLLPRSPPVSNSTLTFLRTVILLC